MNTPAHLVLNLCALGGRGEPPRPGARPAGAILAGALLPDAPMFVFFVWEAWVVGATQAQIWGELYFAEGWQLFFDVFNSIPLALATWWTARVLRRPAWAVFGASWLLHCLCDLPLHREDAHRHFLPFSEWRFTSPVSYWDPAHHGGAFAVFEALLVLAGGLWLWRRYPRPLARASLVLIAGLYLAGGAWYLVYLS